MFFKMVDNLPQHHIKQDFCESRPKYRQGHKLKAVKVYTINDESTYLIISRVQAIKLQEEVIALVQKFGNIDLFKKLNEYPSEDFEEAFLVKYSKIENSKKAKIKLDESVFFGSTLHVFYAPEYESADDVLQKLIFRSSTVISRTKWLKKQSNSFKRRKQNKLKTNSADNSLKASKFSFQNESLNVKGFESFIKNTHYPTLNKNLRTVKQFDKYKFPDSCTQKSHAGPEQKKFKIEKNTLIKKSPNLKSVKNNILIKEKKLITNIVKPSFSSISFIPRCLQTKNKKLLK